MPREATEGTRREGPCPLAVSKVLPGAFGVEDVEAPEGNQSQLLHPNRLEADSTLGWEIQMGHGTHLAPLLHQLCDVRWVTEKLIHTGQGPMRAGLVLVRDPQVFVLLEFGKQLVVSDGHHVRPGTGVKQPLTPDYK